MGLTMRKPKVLGPLTELWTLASSLQPRTVYMPQLSELNPGIAYLTKY